MTQKRHIRTLQEKIDALENELKTYQESLSRNEDKMNLLSWILDKSVAKAYAIDGDHFSYVSMSFATAFGYDSPSEIVGKFPVLELVAPECRDMVSGNIQKRHKGECDEMHYTFTGLRKDGTYNQVEVRGHSMMIGSQRQVVGVILDMTHYKRMNDLAYYDSLTQLPNRVLFTDRLEEALSQARNSDEKFSVMFVDLDEFKQVNDNVGHAAGDLVLQESANRMTKIIHQKSDTVSRAGGDEFVILLRETGCKNYCAKLALDLIQELGRPIRLCNHTVTIGASIGISFFPDHGEDSEAIVQAADMAMYEAKRRGKRTYAFAEEAT